MSVQGSPCLKDDDAAAERVAKENAEDDAEKGEDEGEAEGDATDGEEEEEGEDEDAEEEEEEGKQLRNAFVLINTNSKDSCCPLMCFQSSIVWYTSGKCS